MWNRISLAIAAILTLAIIAASCGSDENPVVHKNPPESPVGVMGLPVDLDNMPAPGPMTLFWLNGDGSEVDGYNIYRRINKANFVKINDALVVKSGIGPGSPKPQILAFVDSGYESSSTETYTYGITAVRNGRESARSEDITGVPASFNQVTVTGLTPDNEIDVPLTPTMSWDQVDEANSYSLILWGDSGDSPIVLWLRIDGESYTLGDPVDQTYVITVADQLPIETQFNWTIAAVDSTNFAYAAGSSIFTTTDPLVVARLIETIEEPGRYRLCWDQIDKYGSIVPLGNHIVRISAGDFEDSKDFIISTSAVPIYAGDCSHVVGGGVIPASYQLFINGTEYAPGDTVVVTYWLPATSEVRVNICR